MRASVFRATYTSTASNQLPAANLRIPSAAMQLAASHASSGSLHCRTRSPPAFAGANVRRLGTGSSAAARMAAAAGKHDLLIVGPGVLGSLAGQLWKQQFSDATVVAQTNTTNNHEKLKSMGLSPRVKAAAAGEKYPYVLFAAPPSGSEDYAGEVKAATDAWDKTGSFVFTSSMSVCAVDDGGLVTEECPVVPQGKAPSTDRLLGAEAATLSAGGNVLRLVGLYHSNRGAHTFFARQQEVARPGKYVVNLLHYEDAASLAVAILKGAGSPGGEPYRSRVFLGCDNHPITFENMMAAVFDSGVMSGSVTFTGDVVTGGAGKSVNNDATRQQLGWTPKYNSFKDFFAAGAKDYYNSAETVKVGGMPHA